MACMLLFCCFVVRGQARAPKVCLDSVRVRLERAARLDSTYFSEIDLSIGHLSIGELLRNIARVHGVNLCVKVDEGRMVTCNFNRARLIDLLYLENINLHNYSCLLKDCLKRTGNSPMYSCYSEERLKLVYEYLCSKSLFCNKDEFSNFFKIFKSEASDVTHKIKVNTSRTGAKALLRVAVEELTKQFSASLVNLFFADKDGGDLKIASHHRATAYDDYRREIARILS